MSAFLIGKGTAITVEGTEYKADKRGVVEIPGNEFDTQLINCHGLTLYVEGTTAKAATEPAVLVADEPAAE